jgi:DnaK suppressor protein
MDAKNLRYFKQVLTNDLQNLMHQEEDTRSVLMESDRVFPDLIDQAVLDSQVDFKLRIRGRQKQLIQKIQRALDRIEDGSFGICEECGEDIPVKRLKARPVTTLCIVCKSRLEARERAVESGHRHLGDLLEMQ